MRAPVLQTLSIALLLTLAAASAYAQPQADAVRRDPPPLPSGAVNEQMPMPDTAGRAPPGVDILPAKSLQAEEISTIDPDSPTHPPIRLTPDKSEIVRLDGEAATVIVGNPAHLSVMAENTKTLVLVPKATGATYFTVLDKGGKVLMQRHVLVAAPADKYIRIRKSCANSNAKNCQTTQVYYCPDICHQINMGDAATNGGGSGAAQAAGTAGKLAGSAAPGTPGGDAGQQPAPTPGPADDSATQ